MADLGNGPGGPNPPPPPPLFWVKKVEMTEGKMAAMASKSRPSPLSLRSGSATDIPSADQYFRITQKLQKGDLRNKKSITFHKGTSPWTSLEGTRCFGNQSPLIRACIQMWLKLYFTPKRYHFKKKMTVFF